VDRRDVGLGLIKIDVALHSDNKSFQKQVVERCAVWMQLRAKKTAVLLKGQPMAASMAVIENVNDGALTPACDNRWSVQHFFNNQTSRRRVA